MFSSAQAAANVSVIGNNMDYPLDFTAFTLACRGSGARKDLHPEQKPL